MKQITINKKKERKVFKIYRLIIILVITVLSLPVSGQIIQNRPFRVAVVIGDQWNDPSSYLLTAQKQPDKSDVTELPKANDLHTLAVLLKSWSIPFDIIRLDQQFLDPYLFLNMEGNPKYGTIIWDVNESQSLFAPNFSVITEVVEKHGIGLIALSDRISQPEIQSLLGIKYIGSWQSNTKMEVTGSHFLTQGLNPVFKMDEEMWVHVQRQQVELKSAKEIVNQAGYTQATVNELPLGVRTVWIGNDYNYLFYYPDVRTLLRRAITWTIGYNVFKKYTNEVIMIMDDPGGSQNVYLDHWHHPVLTEKEISNYLIKPLKENGAILNINLVPAFVDDKTGRLEPSWKRQFVDEFGTKQDYVSSKQGYEKGIEEGVFEVMCHGLTHMQPDMISPPGWKNSSTEKEKAEVGWYREFGDTRRYKEIPAAEQKWRMNTAREWIIQQFGVEPLEFCPGGDGVSKTYFNNTSRLAGEAGFGWLGWQEGYLGKDLAILNWQFQGKESPLIVGSKPNGHNFGITYAPEGFSKIFSEYPNHRFISINEFIGYLHTLNSGGWDDDGGLFIAVHYDLHYCRYFEKHHSTWNIEFADWFLESKGTPEIRVDGMLVDSNVSEIQLQGGLNNHTIQIKFNK